MPPAMVIAPIESPNAGAGLADRLRRGRTASTESATPERAQNAEGVVAAGVGVGTAVAVAGAAHVDDVRVVRPDVVDVDLQPLAHARHLVGEEDVGDRAASL